MTHWGRWEVSDERWVLYSDSKVISVTVPAILYHESIQGFLRWEETFCHQEVTCVVQSTPPAQLKYSQQLKDPNENCEQIFFVRVADKPAEHDSAWPSEVWSLHRCLSPCMDTSCQSNSVNQNLMLIDSIALLCCSLHFITRVVRNPFWVTNWYIIYTNLSISVSIGGKSSGLDPSDPNPYERAKYKQGSIQGADCASPAPTSRM